MIRSEILQIAKPILFNTDMVRAIQDGRKTVTRRVIKDTTCIIRPDQEISKNLKGKFELYNVTPRCGIPQGVIFKPPYQAGDYLYVRETWGTYNRNWWEADYFMYRADYPEKALTHMHSDGIVCDLPKWRPSIHMPKEAARIFLRVTDVRAERLKDITWQQAADEGCYGITSDEPDPLFHLPTLRGEFKKLWNSTIKKPDLDKYGWDANPWVWAIEFEKVEV